MRFMSCRVNNMDSTIRSGFDVKSSFNLETILTLWFSSKYYFGVLEFEIKTQCFTCFIFISILGILSSNEFS